MARQTVLVLTPDFPPAKGGIQTLIHRVVSSWGHFDPCVVTLAAPGASSFDAEQPFRVHRLGVGVGHRAAVATLNTAGTVIGLGRRPVAVLSGHITASPAAWCVSRLLRVPFVQYLYGREIVAHRGLTSFAVTRASCTIVISRFTRQLAIECGASPERIRLIHPGVALSTVASLNGARRPDIVCVARLDDRYKGHDVLIRALPLVRSKVPDTRLLVIGDGELRPSYEHLARSYGLADAVVFEGSVDDTERDRVLDESSIFAMPSGRIATGEAEGFGIVFLEAGVHAMPVVAGAAGGAVDAVIDGETGFLVDPRDHVAVADAITFLLTNPKEATRLGDNGARRAEDFAWPIVGKAVEDILIELVEAR